MLSIVAAIFLPEEKYYHSAALCAAHKDDFVSRLRGAKKFDRGTAKYMYPNFKTKGRPG